MDHTDHLPVVRPAPQELSVKADTGPLFLPFQFDSLSKGFPSFVRDLVSLSGAWISKEAAEVYGVSFINSLGPPTLTTTPRDDMSEVREELGHTTRSNKKPI